MAVSDLLQARGIAEIISGGYPDEPVGTSPAFKEWTSVEDDNEQGAESTYYYSDSNDTNNATRSQTNVTIKTTWRSSVDDQNIIHIATQTYLTKIERIARPDGSSGDTPNIGRDVYIFPPEAPCAFGAELGHWYIPWNASGTIYSGNLFISSETYDLPPGQTSGIRSATVYRNVTEGFSSYLCKVSSYSDSMALGFQFRNNMPTQLPPPVWTDTAQIPDICENYMDVFLTFSGPPVSGVEIYLEYRYDGQDWSEERSAIATATRNTPVVVELYKIIPTNHTANPTILYWRAKFRPTTVKMEESDWTYGETKIEYIPAPNMTVPDITVEECTAIGKGDYIPPYTEEQCYLPAVCEEQDQIREELQEREWEKNRHCREVNGDTSTKGDK